MKKLLTLTLILLAGIGISESTACAVVEISGPSEMFIDAPYDEGEKATFKAENLEGHIWRESTDTYLYTEWDFVLGTKRGEQVTYDTESMANLQPGTYTLTCTSYFTMYGGSTQTDTKEIIIKEHLPDLTVYASYPSSANENSSIGVNLYVYNRGESYQYSSLVDFYFSKSNTDIEKSKFYAGSYSVPIVQPGGNYYRSQIIKTPNYTGTNANGSETWYLWVIVDSDNFIEELNENNNKYVGNPVAIKYNPYNPRMVPNKLMEEKPQTMSIYPVPANETLNFSEELKNPTIIDQYGNKIEEANGVFKKLDIRNLKTGNYILYGYDKLNTKQIINFQKR